MKHSLKIGVSIMAVSLFLPMAVNAASTKQEVIQLKSEIEALKTGQEAMQKDLADIKKLLQSGARAPAAAPSVQVFEATEVTIGGSPVLGDPNATLTLMEFSDYQCPFCSRHYRDTMPTLVDTYVQNGDLKIVMKENPIQSIHSRAMSASQAALCAKDQDKYWEMHNMLFDNQRELSDDNIKSYAANIGLNTAEFNSCLDSNKYEQWVNDDLAEGSKLGIRGTPGFVLGVTDPDDPNKVMMTVFLNGAKPLVEFQSAIDAMLESTE